MNISKIPFLIPKGKVKNNNQNITLENFITSNNYYIGNQKIIEIFPEIEPISDSIFAFGHTLETGKNNFFINFEELFDKVLEFSRKIYKMVLKYNKKEDFCSYIKIEELLKTIPKSELQKLFLDWCKKYNFPISPLKIELPKINSEIIETSFEAYELTYEQILNSATQLLIIYVLNNLYVSLNYFQKSKLHFSNEEIVDFIKNNGKINILNIITSEITYKKFIKYRKQLLEFSNFLKINITQYKLKVYLNKPYREEIINFILREIIPTLNNFEIFFNSPRKKYYSIEKNKIYYNYIYSNIYDVCWEILIDLYTTFSNKLKSCKKCGREFIAYGNQQYCTKHSEENKHIKSSNCQNKKRNLINDMLIYYDSNKEFLNKSELKQTNLIINNYKDLFRNNSKKLEKTKIKTVQNDFTKLKQIIEPEFMQIKSNPTEN